MSPLLSGVSGIRGVIGDGLTPGVISGSVSAFSNLYGPGRILLGRDGRRSGETIVDVVSAVLRFCGSKPVNLGVVPTPTVQLCVEKLRANGGIVVTASHNPIQWNGLKFINKEGVFLDEDETEMLNDYWKKGRFNYVSWELIEPGEEYNSAISDHIESIKNLKYVDLELIRGKRFKVVVDCVNGGGSTALPQLLNELGCQVIKMNCSPGMPFPGPPEPVPENLNRLSETVIKAGADLGIAVDPDADRLALVSNGGDILREECTLVLAEKIVLEHCAREGRGHLAVVANLSTTKAVEDVAREYEADIFRTPVGEIHVVKKMRSVKAVIGGEGNGGVILPDCHLGRDSLVGSSLILQLLAESGLTLAELHKQIPPYFMIKGKVPIKEAEPELVLDRILKKYSGETINTDDGIKIEWENRWVHMRKSNTEPIIRVITEADSREEAALLSEKFLREIGNMIP